MFGLTRIGFLGRTLLVVLICVAIGARQWLFSRQSADWSTTTGEVIQSETRPYQLGDERIVYLSLRYRYQAGGRQLIGRRVTPAGGWGARFEELVVEERGTPLARWWWRNFPVPNSGTHRELAEVASRYPVGAIIEVRFDPDNPERAVLQIEKDPRYFVLAAALLFLALLLAPFAWLYRLVRRRLANLDESDQVIRRLRRLSVMVGLVGLSLVVLSAYRARKAAQPPESVDLSELCDHARHGLRRRWASVQRPAQLGPGWAGTGLRTPSYARCSDQPVRLEASFDEGDLLHLNGCRVELVTPTIVSRQRIDFGPTQYVDDGVTARYQHAMGVRGSSSGLWLLSHWFGEDAPDQPRRVWAGRLIPVAALPDNRRRFKREWQSIEPTLREFPFVLLSDRSIPVGQRTLHTFGECAVATFTRDPDGDPVWALARKNIRDLPNPSVAAGRPLLLEAYEPADYRRKRTVGWRLLQGVAGALAAFGLVPILVGWIDRLYGGAGKKRERRQPPR